ncbi:hypothetical protein ACWDAF_37130, partial [Streptomyces sp. NPDC001226]
MCSHTGRGPCHGSAPGVRAVRHGGAGVSPDAGTLRARVPFRQFIVKVNGRCNLACRYCYLY